jgi:glucose-1-phosphate thymidylyltransferase
MRGGEMMQGIVLAGGSGTHLLPDQRLVSKQLPDLRPPADNLLSAIHLDAGWHPRHPDDHHAGVPFIVRSVARRENALGHPAVLRRTAAGRRCSGLLIGEEFIGRERVALVLGDNLFFGHGLSELLGVAAKREEGATIFAYQVRDPERYGVVSFDPGGKANQIEEKPADPTSNWAITGLYFFDKNVVRHAAGVKPSWRGELEITELHNCYLAEGELYVEKMGRGFAWLDTGTFESLIDAASFVRTLEQRQGVKIACPEEIAYRMGFIGRSQLVELAKSLSKSGYGEYLLSIADMDRP